MNKKINWPLIKNAITVKDRLKLCYFLLTNTKYTNGPNVKKFENAWKNWVGSRYALMTNSGSSANLLLLSAVKEKYNLKDGDKVLVPACTWSTNINPVIQLGFKPIFCDVNLENFSFDIDHLQQIKTQHPDIKIIFITHLLGFSADNKLYQELFPNAIVLDDICESHGCLDLSGAKKGSNSLGATFSFYFGHHITTVEGGMIVTSDPELYDLMRMKRSHGMAREAVNSTVYNDQNPSIDPQFLFVTDGYNLRSTEINAVLGLTQLPRLDSFISIRRNNFARFVNIVANHPDKFYPIVWDPCNSNYSFPFICKTPELMKTIKKLFTDAGIEHRPLVGGNLLQQPFLKQHYFDVPKNDYNVDLINDNGFYIGNSQFVTKHHLDYLENLLDNIK